MLTHSEMLEQLMVRRTENWAQLYEEANIIIADFLLNVASFVREISEDDDPMPVLAQMQRSGQGRVNGQCRTACLTYINFYWYAVAATPLELQAYQQDPFDPELLKSYGICTTSGAAAGALLGLGIDAGGTRYNVRFGRCHRWYRRRAIIQYQ